jgi:hypothetical protein
VFLTNRCAQHRVDEAGRAWLAHRPGHVHSIVYGRRCWNPGQVKELIQTEPEDGDHLGIQSAQWAFGEMDDQVIETALPAERAGNHVCGKGAIAIVLEMLPAAGERRRQVRAAVLDRAQGMKRRDARRRGHDSVGRALSGPPGVADQPRPTNRAPACSGRPAR